MSDEPRAHLPRPVPPWEEQRHTLCGRPITDVKKMGTLAAYAALAKREGQRRAAYDYCQTCTERARYAARSWETDPIGIMHDWLGRGMYVSDVEREHITASLHALSALIEEHREEFQAHRGATNSGAASLSAARAAKRGLRGVR